MMDNQRPRGIHHRPIGSLQEIEEEFEQKTGPASRCEDVQCSMCGNRLYEDEPDCPHGVARASLWRKNIKNVAQSWLRTLNPAINRTQC